MDKWEGGGSAEEEVVQSMWELGWTRKGRENVQGGGVKVLQGSSQAMRDSSISQECKVVWPRGEAEVAEEEIQLNQLEGWWASLRLGYRMSYRVRPRKEEGDPK